MDKKQSLETFLREQISECGITADAKHLLKTICSQFPDHRYWLREYVVNASDSGATTCVIVGYKQGKNIFIEVQDNGCGMGEKKLLDFFNLFRSTKEEQLEEYVGKHGIGKLSVSAIPRFRSLTVHTCNGNERWYAESGNFLEMGDILIKRIRKSENMNPGTRFTIEFESDIELATELEKLRSMLEKTVKYLNMEILIQMKSHDWEELMRINQPRPEFSKAAMKKTLSYKGENIDVVISVGSGKQEVYQNWVLISDRYHLVKINNKAIQIPYLDIVINSSVFELPFGRHKITNDHFLNHAIHKISNLLILKYYMKLVVEEELGDLGNCQLTKRQFEQITINLMMQFPGMNPWFNARIYRLVGQPNISFNDIKEAIQNDEKIYIESSKNAGIDYQSFSSIVLKYDQNTDALSYLRKNISGIIDLNDVNTLLEKPNSANSDLDELSRLFEKQLWFHPEVFYLESFPKKEKKHDQHFNKSRQEIENKALKTYQEYGNIEEHQSGIRALKAIKWKVNYLVEADTITPNESNRFKYADNKVILNLNHPDVKKLVELTKVNPMLAGHWAMSLFLNDQNVLPHITMAAREDLLFLDAMAKVQGDPSPKDSGKFRKLRDSFDDLFSNN